jgi:hypothetical protein
VPHVCAICGVGIAVGEPEIAITSPSRAVVLSLHRRCFDIWTQESMDGDGDQGQPGST